jgi:hypothetical protein
MPDEWEILPDEDFGGHMAHETTKPLSAEVQSDGLAKADNNFRIVLGGSGRRQWRRKGKRGFLLSRQDIMFWWAKGEVLSYCG